MQRVSRFVSRLFPAPMYPPPPAAQKFCRHSALLRICMLSTHMQEEPVQAVTIPADILRQHPSAHFEHRSEHSALELPFSQLFHLISLAIPGKSWNPESGS